MKQHTQSKRTYDRLDQSKLATFRAPRADIERWQAAAAEQGVSFSRLIRQGLDHQAAQHLTH